MNIKTIFFQQSSHPKMLYNKLYLRDDEVINFNISFSKDLESEFNKAKHSDFSSMTVGKDLNGNYVAIYDPTLRLAKISEDLYDFGEVKTNIKGSTIRSQFELLRYDQGGHFVRHIDKAKDPNHTHTICIYPPQEINGGELILFPDPETKIIHSISANKWKIIIMPINMVHSSEPVRYGIKYLFRGTCHFE